MDSLENRLRAWGRKKTYRKDEFLFHARDEARGFFYVHSGAIRIFKMDEEGREVEVVRLKPGDFFGEAIVFAGQRFPSYAQAVKDSDVLFFDKNAIFEKIGKDPATAGLFLALLAGKCLILNERIEALGLQTVRQRLARFLLTRCSGGGSCRVELSVRKADLARQLGTVGETLSRNLRAMQEEGLIEVLGRTILVKDCPRLKQELPPDI
jgi:CRP/FNR family transcriptional regulator